MQQQKAVRWEKGADGIAIVTLDDPSSSANTMNDAYKAAMGEVVDQLVAAKDELVGVIITSAKKTFFAGGNLEQLSSAGPDDAPAVFENVTEVKAQLRKLETLGRPVVAAMNGTALGGGLEIGLACHHRIGLDARGVIYGLPEVTLGLLPGGGGVTRITRMLGIANGFMNVLAQGQRMKPDKALEVGIIDELASTPEEMLEKAKAWIAANPEATQPWDQPKYRIPGGTPSTPALASILPAFPANLRKQLKGAPMPAPRNILAAAVEGAQVDFDTALRIEGRYFVELVCGQVSKNMTKAFFFDLQAINGGRSRPDGYEKWAPRKVAVLGAGMMGAGIAYVCALSGWEVVLKDVSLEAAEKGKAYSESLVAKGVKRGRTTLEKGEALLQRITPTADYNDLAGCDTIIEAVFESVALKQEVFREAMKIVEPDALLCSNTSTLPITELAAGLDREGDFIGLHFFSPVDKMPLVEIIRGERTSDATLAKAFDLTLGIKKTPIVVNDSRGFFTSRVIGTFINEGVAMLAEGIDPQTIEQASSQAGYPAPVLQLMDELTLTLPQKIRKETQAGVEAAGGTWTPHPSDAIIDRLVEEFDRKGKSSGAGFYEYVDGKRTRLWPGLREEFKATNHDVDLHELSERMLFVEAIETQKCFDEGVLTTVPDANIGSIFGIGFPAWTGGVVQYVEGYPGGVAGFVKKADEYAQKYGARFEVPDSLRKKAQGLVDA
ncbi:MULTISPECIES: 3-hydroxyacyl-CoA dehydrogenase NAD-binding domain-containing protein [unclassified Pseudonocardia]|uniref:3-hydroxyacyl-CoA dehydrogenase NAD-binding domain-containing protein n=1 Tax=unclassified Pseudonocardia TaxID=2619320 RepID=UPI000960F9BA|nr:MULTISPECIES: 3-hydroxyacyl-CoA dehydrogenase NAD-binding domain-containing protein [unclassified Pseudonocardia]MBN9097023.1 enoyl-CoA hydratase/isomerase family protein [Pseudonocardia sp.]OJY54050.1 MAG: 3-hydroxyacyl-CoA dehydrogenase [Pseudonocardia sp. 73-21]